MKWIPKEISPVLIDFRLSVCVIILTILIGVLPSVQTIFLARIIDAFSSNQPKENIVVSLCFFIFLVAGTILLPNLKKIFEAKLKSISIEKFAVKHFRKKMQLQYLLIEDSDIKDLISRIDTNSKDIFGVFVDTMTLTQIIIQIISTYFVM